MNQIERTFLLLFALFILFPSCAGDIKGEKGENALASTTLILRGGGKISWNSSQNRVTFTEEISVYDQITNSTITITPSASPITLADKNDVAYVARSTSQDASIKMTEVTVAPITELSSATQANDVIPLFQRTEDDILWLPWLQRELLDGDHIQFGAGTSWYERMAASRKPSIHNDDSDLSNLTVPATTHDPAVVSIDGKLYANTKDAVADLDLEGQRGGLDEGTKAIDTAYYVYGIPGETGRTFDLVLSANPPTLGPVGFSSWTYIGGWITGSDTATSLVKGYSINGRASFFFKTLVTDVRDISYTYVTVTKPKTAKLAEIRVALTMNTTHPQDHRFSLSLDGTNTYLSLTAINYDSNIINDSHFILPVMDPQSRIAYKWNNSPPIDWLATLHIVGWIEDPMAYK